MMYELTQMDARKMGRAEGREEGRTEGETLMKKLIALLLKDGKMEDIVRVTSDDTYLAAKKKEYGLE